MIEVMVSGCNGKMGNVVCNLVEKDEELSLNSGFDKVLVEGYEHNKEFYKLLLEDENIKKRILGIYMEDIYKNLKDK